MKQQLGTSRKLSRAQSSCYLRQRPGGPNQQAAAKKQSSGGSPRPHLRWMMRQRNCEWILHVHLRKVNLRFGCQQAALKVFSESASCSDRSAQNSPNRIYICHCCKCHGRSRTDLDRSVLCHKSHHSSLHRMSKMLLELHLKALKSSVNHGRYKHRQLSKRCHGSLRSTCIGP